MEAWPCDADGIEVELPTSSVQGKLIRHVGSMVFTACNINLLFLCLYVPADLECAK